MNICLFGADPGTGNLGVSALLESVIAGIRDRRPDARLTVFDKARGFRAASSEGAGDEPDFDRCAARLSFKLYQADSLFVIRAAAWLGGLTNTAAKRIRQADAVFDISGGDSFTDLYGWRRFHSTSFPKLIAIEQRIPLILLPQTYGPFRSSRSRRTASRIVQHARAAWARDQHSFDVLRELSGAQHEGNCHAGVDVAFALPVRQPRDFNDDKILGWLSGGHQVVGLNVSGLLYHDRDRTRTRYGFRADYQQIVHTLAQKLFIDGDVRLLLVPHVLTERGHYESDPHACDLVRESLPEDLQARTAVVSGPTTASEMKWVISQCDWFCGTRMHSTIAALSTGIPTAAIAYSPKTAGVFETCDQGAHVADPRSADTDEVVEALWQSWRVRDEAKRSLKQALPGVLAHAELQMDQIMSLGQTPIAGPRAERAVA